MSTRKVLPQLLLLRLGADHAGSRKYPHVQQDSLSFRKWCTTYGGYIFTEHPTWGLTGV